MAADDIANIPSSSTAIQLYRAKISTPETFEELRFLVQQELKEIEGGFSSVEEVVKAIAAAGGGEATQGDPGKDGDDGDDGRGIRVFKQSGTPDPARSEPGDVWFVQGFK